MKLLNKVIVAALLALVAVSASAKGSPPPVDGSLPAKPCMIAVEYGDGMKEYFNANLIAKIGVYTDGLPFGQSRFVVSVHAGSTYRAFNLPTEAAAMKFAEQIVSYIEAKCK